MTPSTHDRACVRRSVRRPWSIATTTLLAAFVAAGCAHDRRGRPEGPDAGWPAEDGGLAEPDRDGSPPPRLDGGDGDGDTDADADADADLPEADGEEDPSPPVGSADRPIPILSFPFWDDRDTATSEESSISSYGCAPEADESGPEIHYEVVLGEAAILRAAVEDGEGVDVDLHLLEGSADEGCLARGDVEIRRPLAAGTYRLVIDSFGGYEGAGPYHLEVWLEEPEPESLGELEVEYFFLAREADSTGPRDTPIYDTSCALIAHVRQGFQSALCIEGSGVLEDGTVVNYGGSCTSSCPEAPTCLSGDRRACYTPLDSTVYPWGMGAEGVPLVPDVSVAVAPGVAEVGTVIYLEELHGTLPPESGDPHDGCVRVDDRGSIDGDGIRLFAGTRARWRAWEDRFPTGSHLTAYVGHPRCFGM